jgi:hypothetical protein
MVNDELGRMWNKADVAYFKVLSSNLLLITERNQEKSGRFDDHSTQIQNRDH